MKRVLSVFLSAVLLLGFASLGSCTKRGTEVETLRGMNGRDACIAALESLGKTERYRADLDAELNFCLLFLDIPARLDDLCVSTYDGNNMHYRLTDKGFLLMSNERLAEAIMSFENEVWYINGSAYYSNIDGSKYFCDGYIPGNDGGRLTDELLYEINESTVNPHTEFVCHSTKDGDCIEFSKEGGNLAEKLSAKRLTYRVYVNGQGEIERINVFFDLYGIRAAKFDIADTECELTLNITREGVEPVSYPENPEMFVSR